MSGRCTLNHVVNVVAGSRRFRSRTARAHVHTPRRAHEGGRAGRALGHADVLQGADTADTRHPDSTPRAAAGHGVAYPEAVAVVLGL